MSPTIANWTPEDALVAVMIAVSASDENMRTSELLSIERMVNHLPVFNEYQIARVTEVANGVFDILAEEDGLDILWTTVRSALPERLFDTAYALACDVAAADLRAGEYELRLLADMRYELNIDRLLAAAIEAAARARHRTL
ncbi:MAG: tellurite resistance TerB family protein [Silicimonas sp.]|nr:tellurite resistance TerB family protein [Silicimonas sp.]